jgi:ketosteroid isomerase-like protein
MDRETETFPTDTPRGREPSDCRRGRRFWLLSVLLLLVVACANNTSAGEGHHVKDSDDFLAWVKSSLYQAELALHNGDPAPRRALWSRVEPVSVFGAMRNAHGQAEIDALFANLGRTFSNCTSHTFELQAYDVVGDMAYTVGLERSAVSLNGTPGTYTLRVTQVYRREAGEWKVVHRHADGLTEPSAPPRPSAH